MYQYLEPSQPAWLGAGSAEAVPAAVPTRTAAPTAATTAPRRHRGCRPMPLHHCALRRAAGTVVGVLLAVALSRLAPHGWVLLVVVLTNPAASEGCHDP
ncbi:hypothetical protein [Streptomyces melanogenes]|uniref:FUSC family protein n=1 Tax=Streptomyces melanogenes TaxID=67326 RepID=A0ABZ1XSN9_9ACTN|nr:hypothetical protein [Streptomyces melanogenes]